MAMPSADSISWVCDECGGRFTKPSEGWLEWHQDKKTGKAKHFRIVHHLLASPKRDKGGCYAPPRSDCRDCHNHLDMYVGPDGVEELIHLLESMDPNPKEWAKLFRRLQLTGDPEVSENQD